MKVPLGQAIEDPRSALLGNKCPADDGAAHAAPAPKSLVDLVSAVRLLLQRALSLNLWIRHVAHREPARLLKCSRPSRPAGQQAENGVAHLGHRAEMLQVVVVVR